MARHIFPLLWNGPYRYKNSKEDYGFQNFIQAANRVAGIYIWVKRDLPREIHLVGKSEGKHCIMQRHLQHYTGRLSGAYPFIDGEESCWDYNLNNKTPWVSDEHSAYVLDTALDRDNFICRVVEPAFDYLQSIDIYFAEVTATIPPLKPPLKANKLASLLKADINRIIKHIEAALILKYWDSNINGQKESLNPKIKQYEFNHKFEKDDNDLYAIFNENNGGGSGLDGLVGWDVKLV